jgi:hypothetical protein
VSLKWLFQKYFDISFCRLFGFFEKKAPLPQLQQNFIFGGVLNFAHPNLASVSLKWLFQKYFDISFCRLFGFFEKKTPLPQLQQNFIFWGVFCTSKFSTCIITCKENLTILYENLFV